MNVAQKDDPAGVSATPGTTGEGPFSTPYLADEKRGRKKGAGGTSKQPRGSKNSKHKAGGQTNPRKGKQKGAAMRRSSGNPVGHPPGVPNVKELGNEPVEAGEKYFDDDMDDMYGPSPMDYGKIDQDDPRANYDPRGGLSGDEGCANCQWFIAAQNRCHVVEGTILATGKSDLWLALAADEEDDEPEPMPVVIVGQDEKEFETSSTAEIEVDDKAAISKREDVNPKEGKDKYGDVKFADPTNKKYPVDTAAHVRSAWSYINKESNANKYDSGEVSAIKGRIKTAAKKLGVDIAENDTKSADKSILDAIKELLGIGRKEAAFDFGDLSGGFKALPDGRWISWWTNNFEDLHQEIFSEKAIDDFITRVDTKEAPYPELWYRHMPVPSGRADWLGRVGHMALATGTFYDTRVGQKMYAIYKDMPDPLPVSHGFLYPKSALRDGVYHAFHTYEISPLKPGEAANPVTGIGVKEIMPKVITAEKIADLKGKIGPELAAAYLQFGEEKSKELENAGLKFKELGDVPSLADPSTNSALEIMAQGHKDLVEGFKALADLHKQDHEMIQQIVQQNKERGDRLEMLEAFVKEKFELQPRATRAQSTVMNPDSPYLSYLAKKEMATDPNAPKVGGVMGEILGMIEKQSFGN